MTLVTDNTLYHNPQNLGSLPKTKNSHLNHKNQNPNSLRDTKHSNSNNQRDIITNFFSSLISRHVDSGTAMSKHISFGIEAETAHMNSDEFIMD